MLMSRGVQDGDWKGRGEVMDKLLDEGADIVRALFRRLSHYTDLNESLWSSLEAIGGPHEEIAAHTDLVLEGDRLDKVILIERGWAIRHRNLADGRRQIVNFLLAGDFFDLQVFLARTSDHSVTTVTPVTALFIKPADIMDLFYNNSDVAISLWWATLQEEAILREQIVRTGRRTALERVAHLILELHRRNRIVHQGSEEAFVLPLTQSVLADALGLSIVHVNRTLRTLTARGLIERDGPVLHLRDRKGLQTLCDFDTDYLHLDATIEMFRLNLPERLSR